MVVEQPEIAMANPVLLGQAKRLAQQGLGLGARDEDPHGAIEEQPPRFPGHVREVTPKPAAARW